MKLINADEVIRDLASLKYSKEYGEVGGTYNLAIDDCIREIKSSSTTLSLYAESLSKTPVKHAHWIIIAPQDAKEEPVFACSFCHCISPVRGYTRYCPHCGALMDEEIERKKK